MHKEHKGRHFCDFIGCVLGHEYHYWLSSEIVRPHTQAPTAHDSSHSNHEDCDVKSCTELVNNYSAHDKKNQTTLLQDQLFHRQTI